MKGGFAAAASLALWLAAPCHAATSLTATVRDQAGAPVSEAVVYATRPDGGAKPAPRPAAIDQIKKEFVPFVVPVQVGAPVTFPNKDNIRHHVYSFSPAKVFELKLYSGVPAKPVVFDKPGAVTLGCNIHDWMVGYIFVVDSPWFAKSANGEAVLADLPPGDYDVRVWHPWLRAEPAAVPVKIAADRTGHVAFRLDLAPAPPPHQ